MCDPNDILRDGLRALPVPEPAADFDMRVLSALHTPLPVWESLWQALRSDLRPLLAGAACALPVTLLALLWTLHAPATFPVGGVPLRGATFAVERVPLRGAASASIPPKLGSQEPSLDALLDKPNLSSADLIHWEEETERVPPTPALPPPVPRRRACLPSPPTLAA